jgi:two-component system, sporulation sensor kinase B
MILEYIQGCEMGFKNWFTRGIFIGLIILVIGAITSPSLLSTQPEPSKITITQWDVIWEKQQSAWKDIVRRTEGWETIDLQSSVPLKPQRSQSAWYRISLPPVHWDQPGLYISMLYGFSVDVYSEEGRRLYHSARDYGSDVFQVLVPIKPSSSEQHIYIRASSTVERIGIQKPVIIGDYQDIIRDYASQGLIDILLGSSLIFVALVMFICVLCLRNIDLPSWLSLNIVILCAGIIMITHSKFIYIFFGEYGRITVGLFDIAMQFLFPALTYYFEQITGPGPYSLTSKLRKFQIGYGIIMILGVIFIYPLNNQFYGIFYFLTVTMYAIMIVLQLCLLIVLSIVYAVRKNMDAILFAIGFIVFAVVILGELVWFLFRSGQYELTIWKWGVVAFVIAFIMIMGRRIVATHEKVIEYSKELEMYNGKLQHSEKMHIISELAASVAHEVRNPLQVTRGFLQLMRNLSNDKEKEYVKLALTELDRASEIITDFLTFAKPELENVEVLNVGEELRQIEGILVPLANMQGGVFELDVEQNLFIYGNSSKFKQVFINLIKNSIEALQDGGTIRIEGGEKEGNVMICIRDNGVGMDKDELARLGEPYFSNKTKGTGLGLMVTFRIVEVMQGRIWFHSEKGKGTEAIVRFPSALEQPPISLHSGA